jgi:hypothetical protein
MRLPRVRLVWLWISAVAVVMAAVLLTLLRKHALEEQRQFEARLTRVVGEEIDAVRNNETDSVTVYAPFQLERIVVAPECVPKIRAVRVASWADLTDQRWSMLKQLPHLESLGVYDSGSAESLFERIQGMESLHRVELRSLPLSDEGMRRVAGLPHLRELTLYEVPGLSDEGLSYVLGNSALERLSLTNTKVGGRGLAVLRELPRLRSLVLDDDRPVGSLSEGVEHLKHLHGLRSLILGGSWGSHTMVQELRRALPNCTVQTGHEEFMR